MNMYIFQLAALLVSYVGIYVGLIYYETRKYIISRIDIKGGFAATD